MSKIAIKRLTKSDLTLFTWHFKEMNAGNQKSINLNADVFIEKLYPDLPAISAQKGKTSFLVDLSIYGPGPTSRHSLARKIVKGAAYKNWRLNGEFISNPLETPERYNSLREGDFALFIFSGEPAPDELKLILVSSHVVEDEKLHARISSLLDRASMREISASELESVVDHADIEDSHAARIMDIEGALEDASQGGIVGVQQLKRWSSKRHISKDDLRRARDKIDAVGALGEEFVNSFLSDSLRDNEIVSYKWVSNENAVEAYDFLIGNDQFVDVKSTSGSFGQKIHISINELLHMKDFADYRLYRVFGIHNRKARLRISQTMQNFAISILSKLDPLVSGVRVDSISVSPDIFEFGEEIEIIMSSAERHDY